MTISASSLDEVLNNVLNGHNLSQEELRGILQISNGNEVFSLFKTINAFRDELLGDVGTFVVNRNLNFSNYCINNCLFCSFQVPPKDKKGYMLSPAELRQKIEEAVEFGCTELCIQGGISELVTIETYEEILEICHDVDPKLHPHAFSPEEISHVSNLADLDTVKTLKRLKVAGLKSMPGTAAEILSDHIRKQICPNKISTNDWIRIITEAHNQGIPTTATMMYGHIETIEDIVKHFTIIRDIQTITRGFTEFVPLPFIHPNTNLYQNGANPGSSSLMDIKVHAAARLYFNELIPNIQASWVKLGPKFAQWLLTTGCANDIGGTILEESITRTAGGQYGQMMTPEELIQLIRHSGLKPAQRDTLYKILKTF